MTESPQDKSDSAKSSDSEEKKASTDFWQAARVVGGTAVAFVLLVGIAAAKAVAGRRPGGP